MASANVSQIINPYTPLAYLPAATANQFEASRYLYVATLGAFLWDWFMSMPEEYRLLAKASRPVPVFVYFLSRISAVLYILTSTLFQAAPIPNCQALQLTLGICYCFAVSSASYLFFLRIQAVFHQNKLVQGIFAILWLGVLGGSITVPLATKGAHIAPTQYCINSEVKSFASTAVIMSTINDSLVFLAISVKLLSSDNVEHSAKDRLKMFFSTSGNGNGLSSISSALFQGGQIYYLTTVGMNLLTMIMVLTPSAPPVYRAMFTIPNNALQSVMACRVFRQLRLGLLPNISYPSNTQPNVPLPWRPTRSQRSSHRPSGSQDFQIMENPKSSDLALYPGNLHIKVTRDVEMAMDNNVGYGV